MSLLAETFGVDQILLWSFDPKEAHLLLRAVDKEDPGFPATTSLNQFPILPLVNGRTSQKGMIPQSSQHYLGIPVFSQGDQNWGALVAFSRSNTPFSSSLTPFMEDLALQLEQVIQNKKRALFAIPQWVLELMDQVHFSVILMDLTEDCVLYVSPTIEKIIGLTPEDIQTDLDHLDRVVPYPEGESFSEYLSRQFIKNTPVELDFKRVSSQGEELWISSRAFYLSHPEAQEEYWVLAFWDISQQRKVMRELSLSKEEVAEAGLIKSKFLANVSHELRTPLNGIMGMLNLLMAENSQEELEEYIQMALKSADSMLGLVQDLLDVTRLDLNKISLHLKEFHLLDMVKSCVANVQGKAQKKNVTIELQWKNLEKESFIGDELRIKKILSNLLSNAVKFTSNGEVRITLSHSRDHLYMAVEDQGIGIEPKMLQEIFNPFHQLEDPYTKRYEGMGIGLTIVKSLLTLMEGTIKVESVVGKGTSFFVDIPPQSGQERPSVRSEIISQSLGPIKKILIAEDEIINRLYLKTVLENHDFHVEEASNGKEALEKAQKNKPDLIFMDISMPYMNGLEAAAKLRDFYGKSPVPIIALTAHVTVGDSEDFLNSGMIGLISKPYDKREILKTINRLTS